MLGNLQSTKKGPVQLSKKSSQTCLLQSALETL